MSVRSIRSVALIACMILIVVLGCHKRPESVLEGGTAGTIQSRGVPVADIQINAFAVDGETFRRVAFGVSDAHGDFAMIEDDGQAAATLPPGKYRLTLESVAADPIPIPPEVSSVRTTPLIKELSSSDDELVIQIK